MVDLPWGDEKTTKFVTNVGLITSKGSLGDNIMAAEWTHHVSYKPGIVSVSISPSKASHENISKSKEFGVSLAASDQNVIASVAGGSTGREVDKVSALKELGFKFYSGKKIKALMVGGAALNLECRVIKEVPIGDHTMFVGEVLEASASEKEPLVYHKTKYWKLTERIQKPLQAELDRISGVVGSHHK